VEQLPAHALQDVACNLCGGTITEPFKHKAGMQIVRCLACGLVYVNPRLKAEALHDHYNSDQSSRTQYYREVECADRKTFNEILDTVDRFFPARGTLLDVGPNIGTCLDVARSRGWEVTGIEINEDAAEYCRSERGLNVVSGILGPGIFAPGSFDVVLMGDVIEHLPDPTETMRIVRRVLKPGGAVFISTPDIDGWAGRLLQIKPLEHLYYFSPLTIANLMTKVGLELGEVGPLDRYHNITAMTHSTTFGGLFRLLGPAFRLMHSVAGDVVARLPLRENLFAVARKPAVSAVEAA
jgi:2-polyprenyl-3-methyl-5-hydroxy-6-metoxy-1,4-benzoquinol methylase